MLKLTQTTEKYGQYVSNQKYELSPKVATELFVTNWLGWGANVVALREDYIEVESNFGEDFKTTMTFAGPVEEMKELVELATLYKEASGETYRNKIAEEIVAQSEKLLRTKVNALFAVSALIPHFIGGLRLRIVALRASGITDRTTIKACLTAHLDEVFAAIKVMGKQPDREPSMMH